jgi:hypothetical protein
MPRDLFRAAGIVPDMDEEGQDPRGDSTIGGHRLRSREQLHPRLQDDGTVAP